MSDIKLVDGAFVFRAGMQIDADGAPHAYHPDSKPGLDFLANAGKPGRWWGLACDSLGKPYMQADGFYISTTSLIDRRFAENDPRRYVDSELVPYVTLTRDMISRGGKLGDLAAVAYGGKVCLAIAADVGPHPGEGSIALAAALGIPADPRHGGVSAPAVSYAVFVGTAAGWPRDFTADAATLFSAWGGLTRLATVLA